MEDNLKTVLSIDIDYIMKPIINLYNDMAEGSNPNKVWDLINEIRNLDSIATIDENNFKYILRLIGISLRNKKLKVVFAEHHDYILEEITKDTDSKYRVINVDHHHDIYYSEDQRLNIDDYDIACVGSWVWYLDKYDLLESYTWIGNENSCDFDGKPLVAPFYKFFNIVNDEIIDLGKVDTLFICKSRGWVHPKFNIYFDYVKEIIEAYKGKQYDINIDNYNRGTLSRPLNINR